MPVTIDLTTLPQPRGSNVIVRVHPSDEPKVGKIVMPGKYADKLAYATIMAVGPGQSDFSGKSDTRDLDVGQVVLMQNKVEAQSRAVAGPPSMQDAGMAMQVGGIEMMMVPSDLIMLVVSKPNSTNANLN